MEHLEGETLAQRLSRGALPLSEALTIAIQIADALDKANRKGDMMVVDIRGAATPEIGKPKSGDGRGLGTS